MNANGVKAVASESVFRQRFDDLPAERTHAALSQLLCVAHSPIKPAKPPTAEDTLRPDKTKLTL